MSSVLFFDLDDTLVDAEAAYAVGMKAVGIDPQSPLYLQARKQAKSLLPHLAPVARSRYLYFKHYLELSHSYSPEKHDQIGRLYEETVVSEMKRQWQSLNRTELFLKFRSKGFKMFVITNETLRLQTMKLKAFDPHGELFDGMITSEEVGAEKPDLKIFEQALKRVSAKAQDCTMIGDSLEKDVRPALQLGMKAFLTCEFQNPKEENLQGILNLKKLSDLYDLY